MASLDILCSNSRNLKNKITKREHKKIFFGPSKILKNISWPISICLKYFMTPTKTLPTPPRHTHTTTPSSYILNVRSLKCLCISLDVRDKLDVAMDNILLSEVWLTRNCRTIDILNKRDELSFMCLIIKF